MPHFSGHDQFPAGGQEEDLWFGIDGKPVISQAHGDGQGAGCELGPSRDDDGAGLTFFAYRDDVAAGFYGFCHFYTGPAVIDAFLGDDRIAVAGDGAARHEAYSLSSGDGAFVDDAGADSGHDFIGGSFMTMDGVAVERRFAVRRIGMGRRNVPGCDAAQGLVRCNVFDFRFIGRQGAVETAPCFGNRNDFHGYGFPFFNAFS